MPNENFEIPEFSVADASNASMYWGAAPVVDLPAGVSQYQIKSYIKTLKLKLQTH